jgi:dienelactone hydrolase
VLTVLEGEGRVPILYGIQALPTPPYRSVYLSRPDLEGRYPPVVVVREVDAMTSSAKSACRRLARYGYVAVAAESRDVDDAVEALDEDWEEWCSDRLAVLGVGAGIPRAQGLAAARGAALILLGGAEAIDRDALDGTGPILALLAGDTGDIKACHEAAGHGHWVRYGDVGPGFHDENSEDFRLASAEEAYDRVIAFLDRHLMTIAAA